MRARLIIAFPRKIKQKDLSVGFTTISFGLSIQEKMKQNKPSQTPKQTNNKNPKTPPYRNITYALH